MNKFISLTHKDLQEAVIFWLQVHKGITDTLSEPYFEKYEPHPMANYTAVAQYGAKVAITASEG